MKSAELAAFKAALRLAFAKPPYNAVIHCSECKMQYGVSRKALTENLFLEGAFKHYAAPCSKCDSGQIKKIMSGWLD